MPKKESTKRGYMTKEEVMSHFDGLKTDESKEKYLSKILEKKGLLAPGAYKTVQGIADKMYGEEGLALVKQGSISYARTFLEKIKDKKLKKDMYGRAGIEPPEIANKREVYIDWAAGVREGFVYPVEKPRDVIKAKDIRRRLERERKK
ncbi:hypothetical protein FJZ20_02615 [Candidatus Pacearchaeota archaeon]|nr:hypothetical protein [Candidatus Pacearchaeota archaeon]